MAKIKILIVEDDSISRELLSDFLADLGDVEVAAHGKEAISAVEKTLESGRPYDLICLDIMMPEVDGLAVLKTIREMERRKGLHSGNRSKVIMTSALSEKAVVIAAAQADCDAYLVKPLTHTLLFAKIREVGLPVSE
ncbi:MAG: response regulator [Proteobacteria bacterium]|nr:response regulator [Pseudomonadota bacterium]MBU1739875.1 response regulator [Pseudomonadota bacterium]